MNIRIITILILVSQIILISCKKHIIKDESLEKIGLEIYLDKSVVKILDESLKEFDIYLEENYKYVSKENQMKEFLNNYYESSISNNTDSLQKIVSSFNFFIKDVELLSSNGFFTTTFSENLDSIIRVAQKWRCSVFFWNKL